MRYCVIILLLVQLSVFGQQESIYSQYLFNPYIVNPAYAGSRDAVSAVLINRNQWVGLEGAPNTQSLSIHVPTNKNKLAWGANFSHDKFGPTRNITAQATAAYHLVLEDGILSFGLRGGILNTQLNFNELQFREENDAVDTKLKTSAIAPTFDFGLYYYTPKFYAGISSTHITKHQYKLNGLTNHDSYYLRRHYYFTSGYVFDVNYNTILKPSILMKYTEQAPLSIDFNLQAMFYKRFWLGIGLRNFNSIILLTDINITDYLRIGYSYDLSLTKLSSYSYGSHEILIGFDFNLKKGVVTSPRYL